MDIDRGMEASGILYETGQKAAQISPPGGSVTMVLVSR